MTNTLVIANAHSGSAEEGERLSRLATGLGWRWEYPATALHAMELARAAADAGVERIIAAGGDGTVHTVVQALLHAHRMPILAVLPLGTGNDLVRTLGFAGDSQAVLTQLAGELRTRDVDVAEAVVGDEQRWLINSSAGGFSGEVDRALDESDKQLWGSLAYVRGALDVIGDLPSYDVELRIGGDLVDVLRCVGITVMNGRTCGGGLQVAPTADLEDGLLDVMLVESGGPLELAAVGAQLKTGTVLSNPLVHHHLGAQIALTSDPPMPINVDGELLGDVRSARWSALPGALRVQVGPEYRREATADFGAWVSRPGV